MAPAPARQALPEQPVLPPREQQAWLAHRQQVLPRAWEVLLEQRWPGLPAWLRVFRPPVLSPATREQTDSLWSLQTCFAIFQSGRKRCSRTLSLNRPWLFQVVLELLFNLNSYRHIIN